VPLRASVLACLLLFTLAPLAQAADPPAVEEGVHLFRLGRYDDARAALTPAATAQPPNGTAVLHMGRIAMVKNDPKEAQRWFESAVALDANSSTAHMWLGRAYGSQAQKASKFSMLGLAKKIKKEFERAVELDPHNLDARDDLITFYLQAPGIAGGSVSKAKEEAAKIEQLDPLRGAMAHAAVALDQKDFAGAEHQYRSAIASYPESLSVRYGLGILMTRGEKYDEAIALFDSILAAHPDELIARYQIGRTGALSGKQLDRAEQELKTVLAAPPRENGPRPAGAHWRLGMVYEKQGKKDQAKAEYEKSLAIDPGFDEAKKSLAKLK
jgi:tetratricopeptide (TPR) repeat protein